MASVSKPDVLQCTRYEVCFFRLLLYKQTVRFALHGAVGLEVVLHIGIRNMPWAAPLTDDTVSKQVRGFGFTGSETPMRCWPGFYSY